MESQLENHINAFYIELELVLDIYSLVFCSIRFHLERKYKKEISNNQVALLYGKSMKEGVLEVLEKALEGEDDAIHIEEEAEEVITKFLEHSKSLKPTVPSIHILNELKRLSDAKIILFSYLQEEILSKITDPKLVELVTAVKNFDEVFSNLGEGQLSEKTMVIYGSLNHSEVFTEFVTSKKINLVHVSQPKQESLDKESYKNIEAIPFEKYGLAKLSP